MKLLSIVVWFCFVVLTSSNSTVPSEGSVSGGSISTDDVTSEKTGSVSGRSISTDDVTSEKTTPSETSGGNLNSNTTLNENNASTTDSSPAGNTTGESTVYNNVTSPEGTGNDTIIVYSPTEDKNSTTEFNSTVTVPTVTVTTTESTKSACTNYTCKNGGTCVDDILAPYFTCLCASGFTGIRCGTVDKCFYSEDRQRCKNGICKYQVIDGDLVEIFCVCSKDKYWDSDLNECRAIKTVCDKNPCENGGDCEALSDNEYNCTCGTGYSGTSCEVRDLCVKNEDCGHGMCQLSEDKKTRSCKCDDGYFLQDEPHACKVITNVCDTRPCQNGGSCNWLGEENYNCTCKTGFSGTTCDVLDLCVTDKECGNGNCIFSEGNKTRSCSCSAGFYLEKQTHTCKKKTSICQENPCLYDGVCLDLSTTDYNCTCSEGFSGKNCEVMNLCVTNGGNAYCRKATCQNNYERGIFYCICPEKQYFQNIERKCVEADLCPLVHCETNEMCLLGKCVCKDNYVYNNSTKKCEPDFCSKKPCPVLGMICVEGTGPKDYKCSCQEGYTFNGTHCNEALCIFPQLNRCQQKCRVVENEVKCSCDGDFNLKDDNKTCELIGNNTCQVKVCDKGMCALKSGADVCICPPGFIEVNGTCIDVCSAGQIPEGICPDGCEVTAEGGFRCKCRGKFAHSKDQITCEVRNMCQENEIGWKKCAEKNAECIQNWNKTDGFECKCSIGHVETEDGTCQDICSVESNLRMCALKGATCDVDSRGNVTCRCPSYFQLNEEDGKCSKTADVSYTVTLPLDLSTYSEGSRKKRSLDTTVDYSKISRDVNSTIEEMFKGYKRSNILYCNPTSGYIICKIELQFDTGYDAQLKLLGTKEICLTDEDPQKCLLPPALVLAKERISEDFIIQPTDPCEKSIKEENCGSETTCTSSVSSNSVFNCTCKLGFTMRKIDYDKRGKYIVESCIDIDECLDSPCVENSICTNTLGSFTCTCLAGFRSIHNPSGSDEIKCVEICKPNPCTHGLCSTRGDHEFDCNCDAGYRGALCDLHDENFKRERNNSIILGVVLGGILLITFILFAVCVSRLRKQKSMDNLDCMGYGTSTEMKERGRINNAFQRE